jgi:DUF1680 family protein
MLQGLGSGALLLAAGRVVTRPLCAAAGPAGPVPATAAPLLLRPFLAGEVRLLPGSPYYDRQELHRKGVLAAYEPDRLLFHYRALAKLPQAEGVTAGYKGWESGFLRGHMAGHYLSAASRMAAATGDTSFRDKVDQMVEGLAKCQNALGQDGYLAAFPLGAFDRLVGNPGNSGGVIVPYYTVHKLLAGLLDAHTYLGNARALSVAVKLADFVAKRCAALSPEQIERVFRTDQNRNPQNESGAMSEALARLAAVTGDPKHLQTAKIFNRAWFVEPLASGEDRLGGMHANTHIAQAIGLAGCANLTGDPQLGQAAENFWRLVTRDHSFVNGGNSFNEWFDQPGVETGASIDGRKELPATTAESCNTHNMLKLTAHLFARQPDAAYADYYERALHNHLLTTVAPDTGAMTYFTPLRGNFRTYLDGTFCCTGTGIENAPRYGEGIDFQRGNSLWVNLYIPSHLDWKTAGLELRQEGNAARGEPVRLTIVKAGPAPATLNLRIPGWIASPATVRLNGSVTESAAKASTYVALNRRWQAGDTITLTLPAALRLEHAKDSPAMVSVFYGPVLLAGELGRENLPKDFADKDANLKTPTVAVPDIVSTSANPADWLKPLPGSPTAFTVQGAGPADGIVFRPLHEVHHQRYSVYWKRVESAG